MTPPVAIFGFIVFLWIIPKSEQNLNLYMDAKETNRLLGKFWIFENIVLVQNLELFFEELVSDHWQLFQIHFLSFIDLFLVEFDGLLAIKSSEIFFGSTTLLILEIFELYGFGRLRAPSEKHLHVRFNLTFIANLEYPLKVFIHIFPIGCRGEDLEEVHSLLKLLFMGVIAQKRDNFVIEFILLL